MANEMPWTLDPFRFLLIALSGWMNQRQLQMIDYLHEENRSRGASNWAGAACGSTTTSVGD